jgi:hypothetical protein
MPTGLVLAGRKHHAGGAVALFEQADHADTVRGGVMAAALPPR